MKQLHTHTELNLHFWNCGYTAHTVPVSTQPPPQECNGPFQSDMSWLLLGEERSEDRAHLFEWNFYRCGTVRIDIIKLCGAVDFRTARFCWFIVVFTLLKRERQSARYSLSFWSLCIFTRINRWWTLDCWISVVLTCLWAVRRNKPALPGVAAAAGQDEGGIFFLCVFWV